MYIEWHKKAKAATGMHHFWNKSLAMAAEQKKNYREEINMLKKELQHSYTSREFNRLLAERKDTQMKLNTCQFELI